jgi:uncharacterized protein (DUF1330 family)
VAGYVLTDLEITDPQGFQEHLKLAGPSAQQYEGKVLVGGAAGQTLLNALPNGQLATLDGQTHTFLPEVLASVLVAYCKGD